MSHVHKLMSNDLSLLHCNIRSLYENIDKLEEIVSPCSKPLALPETRIKESYVIAGYNFINEIQAIISLTKILKRQLEA